MATKKTNIPSARTYMCYICGKMIIGDDHVYIKPRGCAERHICYKCVPRGSKGGKT